MYYLLVQITSDEDKECRRIQAVEPELCRRLIFERALQKPGMKLSFRINPLCLHKDCLQVSNVSGGRLCSQHFIDVLTSESIPFTAYPVHLLDVTTGKPIAAHYWFWIPIWIEGTIDWETSEVWVNPETGKRHLTKMVLIASGEAAPLLFQTKETGHYLIHDKVRTRLQVAGITGVAFAPLDAASIPLLGVQKLELERILQRHPDNVEDWCKLSYLLWQLHRQQESLAAIDRALTLKPDLEEGWYRRGLILYELEHLQEALEALKQAVQANPQSLAWKDYSAVLRRLGSKEEALASAEHLVQIWSSSPVSWYELGAARAAMGHAEEADIAEEEIRKLDQEREKNLRARPL